MTTLPQIRTPRVGVVACVALLAAGCAASAGARDAELDQTRELIDLGDAQFNRRQYAEAFGTYKLAVVAAERDGVPPALEVEALAQVAHAALLSGDASAGRPWLERARGLATPAEPASWSRFLLARGAYENAAGERERAERTFAEMFAVALENGLVERALQAAHMGAVVSSSQARIDWLRKGIEVADGRPGWQAPLVTNLARTLESEGRLAEARGAYEEAGRSYGAAGDGAQRAAAEWSAAHVSRLLGELDAARAGMEACLGAARAAFERAPSWENAEWVGRCLEELGEVELAAGREGEALRLLSEAVEMYGRAGDGAEVVGRARAIGGRLAGMGAQEQG